ncbi:OTU protein [Entomophthora muscae]|uniref:OTU protein n=1 Tax=Entomophthora muscae TaxID=34485 RepID=A0ACC2UCM5_9FUNG|nr:OTU protein [Entomophthora muscae]
MDSIEELEAAHAQEVKDLEKELDKLRKTIDKKADKAKKRGVNAKIDSLKRELEVRQEEEMYKFNLELQGNSIIERVNQSDEVVPEQAEPEKIQNTVTTPKIKGNRHQKKKERKKAELQRLQDEAEEEAKDLPNLRKLEE